MSSVALIVGDGVTVKSSVLVSPASGVATEIFPVVAPTGTTAVIEAEETTVKLARTPLNFTLVTPVKPLPEMVTALPGGPETGLMLLIFGRTLNTPALTTGGLAPQPDTVRCPEIAVAGTTAVIC